MGRQLSGLTRRALLLGAAGGVGVLAGRALVPTSGTGPLFPPADVTAPAGGVLLNDASELSPTPVASHVSITREPKAEVVERVRKALTEARAAGRPLVASTARHSMGAQSLSKDGTVVTLDQDWLEPDTSNKIYRVGAGTRWSVVISKLDAIGFSPAVMQSNNDFGVASTFSVNAHGWPVPFSGCGSTVRSISILLPDGTQVTCSRTENAELFLLDKDGISDDITLFNEKLREWEDYYNCHRPHGALSGQTPYERLLAKTRATVSPGS